MKVCSACIRLPHVRPWSFAAGDWQMGRCGNCGLTRYLMFQAVPYV